MVTRGREPRRASRDPARRELLAEVASLYYLGRLDQEEIAARIGVSRSTVSRMLTEANETGVVEIRIRRPLPICDALQRDVIREFRVRDAVILAAEQVGDADILARVGRLAARYLDTTLDEADTLAISWGTALRAVADGLEPTRPHHGEVVQMIGGAGPGQRDVDGTELARRFADILGGRYRYLNAPLFVDDPRVAEALRAQPTIREALDAARRAHLALVGVGALVASVSSLLRAGYLTDRELIAARATGAVGDVCGHHLDVDGRLVDLPLARRIVGIEATALRRLPRVVAVAAGPEKVTALLAALRSEIVNVVVTDSATMRAVLDLHRQTMRPGRAARPSRNGRGPRAAPSLRRPR